MKPDVLSGQSELFLEVLECGSFSAAARRLQLRPSAVARHIAGLEPALGSPLFQRHTHEVHPTPAGQAFAELAWHILDEPHQARANVVSLDSAPPGLIRIDAPAPFAHSHPPPAT